MSGLIYLSITGDDAALQREIALSATNRPAASQPADEAIPESILKARAGGAGSDSRGSVTYGTGSLSAMTLDELRAATSRRQRYTTLAERCELGTADSGIRCGSRAAQLRAGGASGEADDGIAHTISGRVMTTDGYGIGGVSLVATRIVAANAGTANDSVARDPEPVTRYQAVSNSDGSYTFSDIPEGNYRIQSARHGRFGSVRITARTGVDYADIVLSEQKQYLVEGSVIDDRGSPLSHVTVLPIVEGSPSVRTDRSGRYQLPVSLAPGASHVTLRFEAPGFSEHRQTASLLTARSAFDSAESARVAVDVVLEPIAVTTNVTGTLTTSKGKPLPGKTVELRAVGSQERYRTVSSRDGGYEFPVIPADKRYRLSVAGEPNHADFQAEVMVTSQAYRFDAVIEPFEFGTLRGRIVDQDGGPVPNVELALRNTGSARPNAAVRSDASGNFVIRKAPAGEAILASQAMPAFSVRGIQVRPGAESRVDLVVDWGSHELSGIVLDRNGRAVPASQVLLTWSHRSDSGIRSSVTRRAATDYQGRFHFDQLGPGPHSLVVDAPGFERIAFDHEIRRDGYDVTVQLH